MATAGWTRKGVVLAFVLALGAFTASTSRADLIGGLQQLVLPTCGTNSQTFSQFGDSSSYFGFPNNGFESGTSGWTVSRGAIVAGNEPWYVNGAGSHSLSLGPGGTAASPLVCISVVDPDWRMFVQSSGANGALHAQVVFYGLLGNVTGVLNAADFNPSNFGSWGPSPTVNSLLALPLATRYAQLRLSYPGSSGSWQVDDVFVDPWAVRG